MSKVDMDLSEIIVKGINQVINCDSGTGEKKNKQRISGHKVVLHKSTKKALNFCFLPSEFPPPLPKNRYQDFKTWDLIIRQTAQLTTLLYEFKMS